MTPEHTTTGIDLRDGVYYAARVEHSCGKPKIKALARFEGSHLEGHPLLQDARLAFSIPDDRTFVRELCLPASDSLDIETRARFEFSQILLADERDFMFETISTTAGGRYLGLAIRERELRSIAHQAYPRSLCQSPNSAFRSRALALGRGFLSYSRFAGGELIGLADFRVTSVAVALVHAETVAAITQLDIPQGTFDNERGMEQLAVELKTMVSFRLLSLFERGVSIPLSSLLVCGEKVDDRFKSLLAKYFTVAVDSPVVDPGHFSDPSGVDRVEFGNYLVALGLTVD